MEKSKRSKTTYGMENSRRIKFAKSKLIDLMCMTRELTEHIATFSEDEEMISTYFKALKEFVEYEEFFVKSVDDGMKYYEVNNISTYRALSQSIKTGDVPRTFALMTQMYNYLAHTLDKKSDCREIREGLFGMKRYMINEVVKFFKCSCRPDRTTGYDCYGLLEEDNELKFVVDVPGCGQLSWHMGPKTNIKEPYQKYPYRCYYTANASNIKKLRKTFVPNKNDISYTHDKMVINESKLSKVEANLKNIYKNATKDTVVQNIEELLKDEPNITRKDSENVRKLIENKIPNREREESEIE